MSRTGWGGFGLGMELEKCACLDYTLSNDFCRIMKIVDGCVPNNGQDRCSDGPRFASFDGMQPMSVATLILDRLAKDKEKVSQVTVTADA